LLVIALFVATGLLFWKSLLPYSNTRAEAIKIAQKSAGIKTVTAFDIATTDKTVYALEGKDASGKMMGVLLPKDNTKMTVVELDKGVNPDKLAQADTTSVVLSLYKGQPAWEVNNRKGVEIFDFTTGKKLVDF